MAAPNRTLEEYRAACRVLSWIVAGRPHWHQREIYKVLTRRAEHGAGYATDSPVVLLPRQVGKTVSIFGLLLSRTALRPRYAAAYTAQKGTVVTHVMANPDSGWLTAVDGIPELAARWRTLRSQGREMIVHRANAGAYIKGFPPAAGRLRSNALDCVVMDECQEHSHELGSALLADIGPVFTTRPRRQRILMGTAGETGSWWHTQVERARAAGTLVEIGSWPDDADPTDRAIWVEHHPGLRAGMTDIAHLAAELEALGADMFAREYGNRWTGSQTAGAAAIADSVWQRATTGAHPGTAPDYLAVDMAPDGQTACIVGISAVRQTGGTVAGIVEHGAGAAWLPARLREIAARHPALRVRIDPKSPAAVVLEQLAGEPIAFDAAPADRARMHSYFMAELEAGRAAVIPHPAMEAARASAVRGWTESGAWHWSRRAALGDITPLVAWTLAVWASRRAAAKPSIDV